MTHLYYDWLEENANVANSANSANNVHHLTRDHYAIRRCRNGHFEQTILRYSVEHQERI